MMGLHLAEMKAHLMGFYSVYRKVSYLEYLRVSYWEYPMVETTVEKI